MINLHIPQVTFTKKTATVAIILVAVIASIATTINLTRPASASECIRAPHTIDIVSAQAQSAKPGSTVYYHLDITTYDSLACGSSVYTFNTLDGATVGWVAAPANGTQIVDYVEKTGYTVWYTSPTNAYNGNYDQVITVSRAEEPTVTSTTLRYTVIGGQDKPPVPVLDTTSPTLQITSPAAGSILKKNTTVNIAAAASDNIGVTKLQFYVNGTLICQGTATTCAWKAPNTKTSHTISVKAYDAAGNVTTKTLNIETR